MLGLIVLSAYSPIPLQSLKAWGCLEHKFVLIYFRLAFVHWYNGEGMEEASSPRLVRIWPLWERIEDVVSDSMSSGEEGAEYHLMPIMSRKGILCSLEEVRPVKKSDSYE